MDVSAKLVRKASNLLLRPSANDFTSNVKEFDEATYLLSNAKENVNISLKRTPVRTADIMSRLAIRAGYLMKRNEQGTWHRKFCCTVPHTFLYYFDSETSEFPRGIIDLELFKNVSVDENLLKLSTTDEERVKPFYFEHEDRRCLEDWSASISRDRFFTILEERDMYHQMQNEMSSIVDSAAKVKKLSMLEKEAVEREWVQSMKSNVDALCVFQDLLAIIGISEESMFQLTDFGKLGQALRNGILTLKEDAANASVEYAEAIKSLQRDSALQLQELNKLFESEKVANQVTRELLQKEKDLKSEKENEFLSQVDNYVLNLQMKTAELTKVEQKNIVLSDQKKLLVKEVKKLRNETNKMNAEFSKLNSKFEEALKAIDELNNINQKLTADTLELRDQIKHFHSVTINSRESNDTLATDRTSRESKSSMHSISDHSSSQASNTHNDNSLKQGTIEEQVEVQADHHSSAENSASWTEHDFALDYSMYPNHEEEESSSVYMYVTNYLATNMEADSPIDEAQLRKDAFNNFLALQETKKSDADFAKIVDPSFKAADTSKTVFPNAQPETQQNDDTKCTQDLAVESNQCTNQASSKLRNPALNLADRKKFAPSVQTQPKDMSCYDSLKERPILNISEPSNSPNEITFPFENHPTPFISSDVIEESTSKEDTLTPRSLNNLVKGVRSNRSVGNSKQSGSTGFMQFFVSPFKKNNPEDESDDEVEQDGEADDNDEEEDVDDDQDEEDDEEDDHPDNFNDCMKPCTLRSVSAKSVSVDGLDCDIDHCDFQGAQVGKVVAFTNTTDQSKRSFSKLNELDGPFSSRNKPVVGLLNAELESVNENPFERDEERSSTSNESYQSSRPTSLKRSSNLSFAYDNELSNSSKSKLSLSRQASEMMSWLKNSKIPNSSDDLVGENTESSEQDMIINRRLSSTKMLSSAIMSGSRIFTSGNGNANANAKIT